MDFCIIIMECLSPIWIIWRWLAIFIMIYILWKWDTCPAWQCSVAGTVPSLQPFKSIIVWRSQRFQLRLRLQLKPGSDEQFEFSWCLSLGLSTLQSPPLSLQPSTISTTIHYRLHLASTTILNIDKKCVSGLTEGRQMVGADLSGYLGRAQCKFAITQIALVPAWRVTRLHQTSSDFIIRHRVLLTSISIAVWTPSVTPGKQQK